MSNVCDDICTKFTRFSHLYEYADIDRRDGGVATWREHQAGALVGGWLCCTCGKAPNSKLQKRLDDAMVACDAVTDG